MFVTEFGTAGFDEASLSLLHPARSNGTKNKNDKLFVLKIFFFMIFTLSLCWWRVQKYFERSEPIDFP